MRTRPTRWMLALILATLGTLGVPGISVLFVSPATAASPTIGTHWVWPLSGAIHVMRRFEPPSGPYAPGHRGVDLAATVGQTVRAAGSGVVSFAGDIGGTPMVTVTHGALRTTYQPVLALVHVGEPVLSGGAIGSITIAPTHCGLLPSCLHWGLLRGSIYLDPLTLVGVSTVRLLPHVQLGPPSSGVVTLARGASVELTNQAPANGATSGTTINRAATSLRAAERVRTTDADPHPQQSNASASKPPHVLLASVGVVSGAVLGIGAGVRLRRRRWT